MADSAFQFLGTFRDFLSRSGFDFALMLAFVAWAFYRVGYARRDHEVKGAIPTIADTVLSIAYNTPIWLVGQVKEDGAWWELQGLYTDRMFAIHACQNHDNYFVAGPFPLNQPYPDKTVVMPNTVYPVAEV
jgi:hypothetical protein